MKIKDNNVENNVINLALVNNTAQVNTEINNKVELKNSLSFKTYLEALFYTDKRLEKMENYLIKKAETEQRTKEKLNKINPENINQNPRLSIIGPAFEQLKYNVEEEQFVELFSNIIAGEFDTEKNGKILPAFISIITQLSKDDAILLKSFKEINKANMSIIEIRLNSTNNDGHIPIEYIIIDNTGKDFGHTIKPQKIVLENLERLKLIKINMGSKLVNDNIACENAFNYYKSNCVVPSGHNLSYEMGALEITDFGFNFIDVCCS